MSVALKNHIERHRRQHEALWVKSALVRPAGTTQDDCQFELDWKPVFHLALTGLLKDLSLWLQSSEVVLWFWRHERGEVSFAHPLLTQQVSSYPICHSSSKQLSYQKAGQTKLQGYDGNTLHSLCSSKSPLEGPGRELSFALYENFSRCWDFPAHTKVIKSHLNSLNTPTVLIATFRILSLPSKSTWVTDQALK
jgi:hypothetical protein